MKTSVYINNDVLQVVRVKGRRYKYDTILLKEGTVHNGRILNREELVKTLKEHRKKLGKVSLVIDSSEILFEKMRFKKESKKKTIGHIAHIFALEDMDQYLYDKNVVGRVKKENVVLGCAVPRDMLAEYQAAFKEARIKVLRTDIAINGAIKYVGQLSVLRGKTFLMNILLDNTLISLLFENGAYRLYNRHVMQNELGTDEYIAELYAAHAEMMEIAERGGVGSQVLYGYYIGLDARTMRTFSKYVRANDAQLNVESYKDMDRDLEYIYAIMGNLKNKEDINLKVNKKAKAENTKQSGKVSKEKATKVKKTKVKAEKQGMGVLGIVIRLIFLVILLVPFVIYSQKLAADNAVTVSSISALQTYVDAKAEEEAEVTDEERESAAVIQAVQEYTEVTDKIENSKYVSSELLEAIYSGDVTVDSIEYIESTATLVVNGSADSQEDIVAYSEELRSGSYADEQRYSGYRVNDDSYEFTIDFIWNVEESEDAQDE